MKKTLGELIDELSITNCKIFALMEKGDTEWERHSLDKVKQLNRHRSDLKNAISEFFKERQELKTYD